MMYSFKHNKIPNEVNLPKNVRLVSNPNDVKTFFYLPWNIYHHNPYWAPPFWTEFNHFFYKKNPFWDHAEAVLFIVYDGDQPVGRIAAFIDHLYCEHVGKKVGFFGFFECINNYKLAKVLLQTVESWLASKGMTMMQGPINGRVDNGCGFLYEGFNISQSLLSSYSPPYYISFAEQYNMRKAKDLFSYYVDLKKPLPETLSEKAEQCLESDIHIRRFNRLRTNKELDWWIDFFLKTFSDHWGFVPVSPKEVRLRFGVKQMRWIVDPGLFFIAEQNGTPVAYLWGTPEYNQILKQMNGRLTFFGFLSFLLRKKTIDKGILHLIGISKNLRHHQVASCLNYLALIEMKKRGFKGAEVGWIDADNKIAHKTISLTGARIFKKYRVFEKEITGQNIKRGL